MSGREREILDILRGDPLIAQQALAERLGISRAAVAGHIMHLVDKGLVLGRGYVLAAQRFVLAIGAANMDITGSSVHRLAAQDSTPGRIRCAPGGVARNVAENLARLGLDVRLISAVGDDLYGASLLEHSRRAGVDVQGCEVLAGQATSTYLSLHGPDGDMALALNDMAILEHITPQRLDSSAALVRHAAALVLDCNLSDAALAWIFAQAPQQLPVFAEPVSAFKCRRLLPWLGRIHTLKANRLEAQALSGAPVQDDAQVQAAAAWLHRQGVRQVVLSLGERGVYWSDGEGSGWQAALPVAVVNTSGAGDAMMAGLVDRWLAGDALAQAIGFAAACSALTLTCAQANHASLSPDAVRQLLQASPTHGSLPA